MADEAWRPLFGDWKGHRTVQVKAHLTLLLRGALEGIRKASGCQERGLLSGENQVWLALGLRAASAQVGVGQVGSAVAHGGPGCRGTRRTVCRSQFGGQGPPAPLTSDSIPPSLPGAWRVRGWAQTPPARRAPGHHTLARVNSGSRRGGRGSVSQAQFTPGRRLHRFEKRGSRLGVLGQARPVRFLSSLSSSFSLSWVPRVSPRLFFEETDYIFYREQGCFSYFCMIFHM